MEGKNSTFIVDVCKAYALAFFTTIVLGNVILEFNKFINIDLLNTVGTTITNMICPMLAISLGAFLGVSKIGLISLFIVGAVGSAYGTSGPLITFGLAIILSLIMKAVEGSAKSISLFLFPLLSLVVGLIGFKYGNNVVQKILTMLVNQIVNWDQAAFASGSIKYYILIAIFGGILFISPIGMYSIIPILTTSTAIGNNLSSSTLIALSCGTMAFMISLAVTGLKGNDIGSTLCVALGTPTLMFGNIFHNPLILIEPMIAAGVSTFVAIRFFHLTGSLTIMEYGNCCFIGMVDLFKHTSIFNLLLSILVYFIIPAVIAFVAHLVALKLSLVKDNQYTIGL